MLIGYDPNNDRQAFLKLNSSTIDPNSGVAYGQVSFVNTELSYNDSRTVTSNGNSSDIDTHNIRDIAVDFDITANTGSIQFFIDRKGTDNKQYPIWNSDIISSIKSTSTSIGPGMVYAQSLGTTIRVRWVVTSGSIAFTNSIIGK